MKYSFVITFDKSAHFPPSLKSVAVRDLKRVRFGHEGTAFRLCNNLAWISQRTVDSRIINEHLRLAVHFGQNRYQNPQEVEEEAEEIRMEAFKRDRSIYVCPHHPPHRIL